jgi:hypothetical protein
MQGRRQKRLRNRLGKRGVTFLRWEQGDRHVVSILVTIPQTHRPEGSGRTFTFPRTFLSKFGPRVIADAILAEYARNRGASLGLTPQTASPSPEL